MPRPNCLSENFKAQPFWWEDRGNLPDVSGVLPAQCDVVVIGAGVTGVETARVLAEHGRHVVVLDTGEPGEGASSRNAGQIGRNFKHAYSELKTTMGEVVARTFFDELQQAFDAVREAGEADPQAFGWRASGRVVGAMSPLLLDKLQREYGLRERELGEEVDMLDRAAIQSEMGSDVYVGGIRLPWNGSIQPARYHQFLLRRAIAAGAKVLGRTPVTAVIRDAQGFTIRAGGREIRCRQLMVATNGYSGAALPWVQKRLLPITSYMVATEPLSEDLIKSILPQLGTYHDNRRRSHFFTVPTDGDRVLMGGRTGSPYLNFERLAETLHGDLAYIFPQLADVRLSHAWEGRCSAPIDLFPRFGEDRGLFYALGYSFSGMAMGPHLGRKVAALMLGNRQMLESPFARPSFAPIPILARGPWAMPTVTAWYGWADRPKQIKRRM